jgi:hypothetical protein
LLVVGLHRFAEAEKLEAQDEDHKNQGGLHKKPMKKTKN